MTIQTSTKKTNNWMRGTLAAIAISAASSTIAKADYHSFDATIGTDSPSSQIRLIDTVKVGDVIFDGFNQATTKSYFGDNTLYGNTTLAPLVKLLSSQDSIGKLVPGIRLSLPNASLDVGYLDGGIHTKLKAWRHFADLDWYVTHITNAAPRQKPYSLTEFEATRMVSKHAGILGRATWTNFGGKPKLELGVKYCY